MFDSQEASVQQPERGNSQYAAQSPDVFLFRHCENSEPHLKRAREAGVRYTTFFSVRGTAVLHSDHDPAAGGHRRQSVRFLANQTVTPQMHLAQTAIYGDTCRVLEGVGFKQHVEHKSRWVRMSESF